MENSSGNLKKSQLQDHFAPLHPAWRSFIRFCSEMRYGEIERLNIQDGLPVLAELTKKKVKFNQTS